MRHGFPSGIAIDADAVYFSGNEIAVDATHVYWANGSGTVMKAPK